LSGEPLCHHTVVDVGSVKHCHSWRIYRESWEQRGRHGGRSM